MPATATARHRHLDRAEVDQFHREGWCLLPAVLPDAHLHMLRDGARDAVARADAELDRQGSAAAGITRRGSRYFATDPSLIDARIYDFIYSPLMADIAGTLLGPEVHVFWEQYVIKAGEVGAAFAWHQDSGYVTHDHPWYLTCWVALDDMSEANGTASILPWSRHPASRERLPHRADPQLSDLVGYDGDDPGDPVICPAGSIALFTSRTLHRSGANTTARQRRVYLIQYSAGIIRRPDGRPWGRSECFLRDGRLVGERRPARS